MENITHKGYLLLLRAVILLFKDKTGLDFSLLGTYICFAAEADWDYRHKKYKYIEATDKELASKWSCSTTTVWRKRKKLEKIKLIEKGRRNMPIIVNMELFNESVARDLSGTPFSNKEDFISTSQLAIAKFHKKIAELKGKQGQKRAQSFRYPFKGNLGLSEEGINDKELDKIAEDIESEK